MSTLPILARWFTRPCSRALAGIADEMVTERWRQDVKWGTQHHRDREGEPVAYIFHANWYKTQNAALANDPAWDFILLEEIYEALECNNTADMRAELIQSMAVIAAWIEDLDSRER